jgi:hypothetical protein
MLHVQMARLMKTMSLVVPVTINEYGWINQITTDFIALYAILMRANYPELHKK